MSKPKYRLLEELDQFTRAYITCALWSSTDESNDSGGDPLDDNYDETDLSLKALKEMIGDCRDFQTCNFNDLLKLYADFPSATMEQAGHDFWLTRNGHGAGFWDRGYGELGDKLTAACKPYGSCDLQVYRGKIYC